MECAEQWIELEQAWWLAYCEMARRIAVLNKSMLIIEGGGGQGKGRGLTVANTYSSVKY